VDQKGSVFIEEHNVISLRTACVSEVEGVVFLQLLPAPSSVVPTPSVYKSGYAEWLRSYQIIMYQTRPSNMKPLSGVQGLRFSMPPKFEFLWTDTGNSVAVYLNGEPWAFIDEHSLKAYSKGVINSSIGAPWRQSINVGNFWDQNVFEKTFANKTSEI
jgi:hypothetical protein